MPRFTEIIKNLRVARLEQLEEAQKKRTRKKSKSSKKKKARKKVAFDNPELQKIFDSMPDDCKDLIRGK